MAEQWEHEDQEEVRPERQRDGGRKGGSRRASEPGRGLWLSTELDENMEQRKNIIRHMSSYDSSGCYMKNRLMGCHRAGTTVRSPLQWSRQKRYPVRSLLPWPAQEVMEAQTWVGKRSPILHMEVELIRCADASDVEWE